MSALCVYPEGAQAEAKESWVKTDFGLPKGWPVTPGGAMT